MQTEKMIHKLSTARGQERSRIWLERGRLTRAGFAPGVAFVKVWKNDTLQIIAADPDLFKHGEPVEWGTVAGTADRPIIDITGKKVRDTFGGSTHFSATYTEGKITIRAAK